MHLLAGVAQPKQAEQTLQRLAQARIYGPGQQAGGAVTSFEITDKRGQDGAELVVIARLVHDLLAHQRILVIQVRSISAQLSEGFQRGAADGRVAVAVRGQKDLDAALVVDTFEHARNVDAYADGNRLVIHEVA